MELVVTMAIFMVLASLAFPLSKMNSQRSRDIELRQQLRSMRLAIDQFHEDWNREGNAMLGPFCQENVLTCQDVSSDFGYPVSFEVLLEVELTGEKAVVSGVDVRRYLRQIPTDPMTKSQEWGLRCYRDDPDASSWCGDDIYDVYTTSSENSCVVEYAVSVPDQKARSSWLGGSRRRTT